jgi:hypothetical protein
MDQWQEARTMPLSAMGHDAEALRRCLRLGGLDVTLDRAMRLLPLATALLAGCDLLAALEPGVPGGSGTASAETDRR